MFQEKHENVNKELIHDNTDNNDYDDAEKRAREKLKQWQAFQIAKGHMDNTVNKVLEKHIVSQFVCPMDESILSLLRVNDMENRAVTMAIRNHGLVQSNHWVQSGHFPPPSRPIYGGKIPYWAPTSDVRCIGQSHHIEDVFSLPTPSSSDPLRSSISLELTKHNASEWDAEKVYDSDQQKDFLERAVAEAIKKKGLSALSVDYG